MKGNGKLKRNHLLLGFEKLRIKLSNEDFEKVFCYLDKAKAGYVSFNEFCNLNEECQKIEDVAMFEA